MIDGHDKPVLRATGLVKIFGEGASLVQALRGVDLTVPGQQMLALIGPSGSGKSTLLNVLGGIEQPSQGTILLEETDLTRLSDNSLTLLAAAASVLSFRRSTCCRH